MKLGALRSLAADAGSYQPVGATVRALSVAPGASPLAIEPGLITLHESINAAWEVTPR
jgi:hypothetical protein